MTEAQTQALAAFFAQLTSGRAAATDLVNQALQLLPQGNLPDAGPPFVQSLTQTCPDNATTPVNLNLQYGGRLDFLFCAVQAATAYCSGITLDGVPFFYFAGGAPVAPPNLPFLNEGFKVKWPVEKNATITAQVVNASGAPTHATVYALVYRDPC